MARHHLTHADRAFYRSIPRGSFIHFVRATEAALGRRIHADNFDHELLIEAYEHGLIPAEAAAIINAANQGRAHS